MPFLIPSTNFSDKLRLPSKNIADTQQFLKSGIIDCSFERLVVPHGYHFVKAVNEEHYRLITTNNNSETVYLTKFNPQNNLLLNQTNCIQIKLWRSRHVRHQSAIIDLPKIFFTHLLDTYNVIATDEEQTLESKGFWDDMLYWAFKCKYAVYILDRTKESHSLLPIMNIENFYDHWEMFCWGMNQEIYSRRIIIISKNQLGP